MDKEQLQDFLVKVEQDGVAMLHSRGYLWFKSEFLPYLNLADTLLPDAVELIADCWYLVGDIYDFNGAPLKAVESYKKALEYDDEVDGAYREIANMYEQVGRYTEALKYIDLALERMPDNEELMEDKAVIQDSITYTTEPYLTAENKAWQYAEQLAAGEIEAVIAAIQLLENPDRTMLQCLAQAYGAQGEKALFLETWQKIRTAEGSMNLSYADWFYMPFSIYNSKEIWEWLKELSTVVKSTAFIDFDSLNEHYGEQLDSAEELALICDFQIYRITKNKAALKALAKQYPLWEEVQLG
ncbi:tetratricopeptide repeat protein [Aureispira anguillae]|uniref:Tetratricopeptide repeat protein n=1 Tax=Aureispira anguillae TaxID=2864201 RepID=A0A915YGS9_9BACT|nr:tetratricopeptide repeat protein [Aureispira anguillae]BDS12869.1 hypothetical protein AsAng_0035940 [Aureispira anguillae]